MKRPARSWYEQVIIFLPTLLTLPQNKQEQDAQIQTLKSKCRKNDEVCMPMPAHQRH